MSLFNKPKRNIRRRHFNDEEEDNENRSMESDEILNLKNKTKKKSKPKQTLLSFGEELEEGKSNIISIKKLTYCTLHLVLTISIASSINNVLYEILTTVFLL
jgi:hypothetical protein